MRKPGANTSYTVLDSSAVVLGSSNWKRAIALLLIVVTEVVAETIELPKFVTTSVSLE